jgi:Fe-S cluster assembly ATP-binding protein
MSLLKITDLHARIEGEDGREILKGINLEIKPGEVHAIMGVNGSGKSTLANILGGKDGYEVTKGSVEFVGKALLELDPEVRAREGLFLAFQYPVELPGVLTTYFLRTALNSVREHRGEPALSVRDFAALVKEKAKLLELDDAMLKRAVNEGFSGGEKKRNEVFQMAVLEPKLCILDETDSGLDIDALQTVASGVNRLRSSNNGMLVITHYQRLLNYIVPDVVHVMIDGRIVKSGGKELALELENQGYATFKESLCA